jgi:K+-transporting ATPase KdpF subunit
MDIVAVLITAALVALALAFIRALERAGRPAMSTLDLIAAVVVIALLGYLVFALLAPERLG